MTDSLIPSALFAISCLGMIKSGNIFWCLMWIVSGMFFGAQFGAQAFGSLFLANYDQVRDEMIDSLIPSILLLVSSVAIDLNRRSVLNGGSIGIYSYALQATHFVSWVIVVLQILRRFGVVPV